MYMPMILWDEVNLRSSFCCPCLPSTTHAYLLWYTGRINCLLKVEALVKALH